jgi:hydrogenase expression/formation protein HypE
VRDPLEEIITLDYGSGGKKTSSLIEELLVPAFQNEALSALGDGAVLKHQGDLVFSTDSYVISPYFFPGGDIGKLSVCGTVNDLAMCGGTPRYLSLGFILEEGLPVADLKRIVDSIAKTAAQCGVQVVTGDTKVVERGRGDGIYINTAGIGTLTWPGLSPDRIQEGDTVIVSGTVGDHGTAVMLARSGMMEAAAIQSDCMPLNRLAEAALSCGGVRVLRDPTRGGVATTLNEFVENSAFSIELEECAVPVAEGVASACDILGLDPLYCANEGKMLVIADRDAADEILAALRRTPGGENAAAIGSVTTQYPGKVVLKTFLGGSRILAKLTGAQLPRIC